MIKELLMKIKHKRYLKKYNNQMSKEYIKCSHGPEGEERADYVLSVAAHTIEKGLGCKNIKKGFGEAKAKRLCGLLDSYIKKGFNQNKFGFKEAFKVLEKYIEYKKFSGEDISKIENDFSKIKKQIRVDCSNYSAGALLLDSDLLYCDNKNEIEEFLKRCRSIRNYEDKQVEEKDIKEAIRIANYAPSACNRQPNNVYYTMDKEKIAIVDELVPGNGTIKGETPNFLVVTTKKTHFGLYEYNQWYVNGGIYTSYLRIALNMLNIGNCIYQWSIDSNYNELRNIYNIPEDEEIICLFGIGYYDDNSYCIQAQRKEYGE